MMNFMKNLMLEFYFEVNLKGRIGEGEWNDRQGRLDQRELGHTKPV